MVCRIESWNRKGYSSLNVDIDNDNEGRGQTVMRRESRCGQEKSVILAVMSPTLNMLGGSDLQNYCTLCWYVHVHMLYV